jgi:hypothetical protein
MEQSVTVAADRELSITDAAVGYTATTISRLI